MHETTFSFSHLESPSPGATLSQGRHRLSGWVWPKAGGVFVDVRARIGDQIYPGIHGLPRADLATHFQTGRPVALAEFYAVVDLSPGPTEIVLEILDLEARWSAFQTVVYQVTPASPPVEVAMPSGPLRWHDFCRGLAVILRARRTSFDTSWATLAANLIADLPYPRDLHHPALPLIGFVDEPAVVGACRFGRIPVLGHVFHTDQPLRRLWATTDLQVLQPIAYGHAMPAIGAHYAQYPTAGHSGFHGLVDVAAQLPNPITVRLYAETAQGELLLAQVLRSRVHSADDEKLAYAPEAPAAFDAALAAWHAALQAAGISILEDADFQPGVDRLRKDFLEHRARAPRTKPRPTAATGARLKAGLRLLLVTHNLNHEGAPLFLLDLARHYASLGAQLTVLSPDEGPLRVQFESAGARVQIISTAVVFAARTTETARAAIQTLGQAFDFTPFDLAVCNTFTTFWAVHAAQAARRRVLLYVHESTTPAIFYGDRVAPAVAAMATEAITRADLVSFTTAATRDCHTDYGEPGNYVITPGWIDIARIDRWLAAQTREQFRARFKLVPGELLVTNIGTVSDRKGQHTFVRAVDLLFRRYPTLAARTRFVLLGGRPGVFNQMLTDLLAVINRPNIELHPETDDYLPYYAAADLTICSSYEESSPRVVLEAMVCNCPLLASAVQGIPELVRPELEATLVPAGDTVAWCEAMAKLLLTPAIGRTLAARARARVETNFSAERLLPQHTALAGEVTARPINQS